MFAKYTLIHGQKVLQAHIKNLKLAISDQNLDLIPDYEQRIEVLQDLKFVDKNCTVLLKGRVACEVCIFVFSLHPSQPLSDQFRKRAHTDGTDIREHTG